MAKIEEKDLKELKPLDGISGIRRVELIDNFRAKEKLESRRSREAFLPQSKYTISLSAFTRRELLTLQSLIRSEEVYREEAYKIIHSHILSTSLGDLTLEEFLKNTSFLDLDTLSFLAYTATFKNKGTYSFECPDPDCGEIIEVKLNNDSLIKLSNSELYNTMKEAANKEDYTLDKLKKDPEFFLNKKTYLKLDDSGFIIVMSEPSLAEDAWTLRFSSDKRLVNDERMLGALECIDEIRVPVSDTEMVVIRDKEEILEEIDKLSFYDQKEILDASDEIIYGNIISYEMNEVTCPKCGKTYTDLPINMSNILFYLIYAEV